MHFGVPLVLQHGRALHPQYRKGDEAPSGRYWPSGA